jgi:hypothetical protein
VIVGCGWSLIPLVGTTGVERRWPRGPFAPTAAFRWTTTGRSNLGDLPYQRRTLAAQGLLAGLCLLLCILAALGLAVPSWAAWAATAATNGLVALEKWRLVREDRP